MANMDCNHCEIGAPFIGPYDNKRQCRQCWLFHNHPDYNRGWGGDGNIRFGEGISPSIQPVVQVSQTQPNHPRLKEFLKKRLACKHRGEETGETRPCQSCGGVIQAEIYPCAIHKECTLDKLLAGVACCNICGTRETDSSEDKPTSYEVVPGVLDPIPADPIWKMHRGWENREDVRDRYKLAFQHLLRTDFPPPTKAEGRGIVTIGGGKFWPMLVASANMLREVSDIPLQIWHTGTEEPIYPEDIAHLSNVSLHDATKLPMKHRALRGWPMKTVALLNCGFKEAIYIDADAYFVGNPEPLFNLLQQSPFVYWHDLLEWWSGTQWTWFGMEPMNGQHVPPLQGGHFAIDLEGFRKELILTHWWNQHKDFSYPHTRGHDQDCWRVSMASTKGKYLCLGEAPWIHPAFVCRINDIPTISHRCQGKYFLDGTEKRTFHLPKDDRYWYYLDEFKRKHPDWKKVD
jgi:hypothetical protein